MSLENLSVEELKKELEHRGYFTEALWSIDDVRTKFNISDNEGLEILEKALTNEATVEQIWFAIEFEGQELGNSLATDCSFCKGTGISSTGRVDDSCTRCNGTGEM